MLHRFIAALAAVLLLAGCEQAKEAKNAYNVVTHAAEASKEVAAGLDDAQARQAERVKNGDTLALPYKELHDASSLVTLQSRLMCRLCKPFPPQKPHILLCCSVSPMIIPT